MPKTNENLLEVLKSKMSEASLSEDDLAVQMDVHPMFVYHLCRGKMVVAPKIALKLSSILGENSTYWENL